MVGFWKPFCKCGREDAEKSRKDYYCFLFRILRCCFSYSLVSLIGKVRNWRALKAFDC